MDCRAGPVRRSRRCSASEEGASPVPGTSLAAASPTGRRRASTAPRRRACRRSAAAAALPPRVAAGGLHWDRSTDWPSAPAVRRHGRGAARARLRDPPRGRAARRPRSRGDARPRARPGPRGRPGRAVLVRRRRPGRLADRRRPGPGQHVVGPRWPRCRTPSPATRSSPPVSSVPPDRMGEPPSGFVPVSTGDRDDPRVWSRPAGVGHGSAVEGAGLTAAPLLAGFSFTLLGPGHQRRRRRQRHLGRTRARRPAVPGRGPLAGLLRPVRLPHARLRGPPRRAERLDARGDGPLVRDRGRGAPGLRPWESWTLKPRRVGDLWASGRLASCGSASSAPRRCAGRANALGLQLRDHHAARRPDGAARPARRRRARAAGPGGRRRRRSTIAEVTWVVADALAAEELRLIRPARGPPAFRAMVR